MFLAYVFSDRNEKKFSKRYKNFKEICKMKNKALNKLLIAILVVVTSFATLFAVTSCFDSGSTSGSNGATTESDGGSGNSENSDSDSSSEISVGGELKRIEIMTDIAAGVPEKSTVTINVTTVPKKPDTAIEKPYDAKNLQVFVKIGDEIDYIGNASEKKITYKITENTPPVFYAKYCLHDDRHTDAFGDISSDEVTVNVCETLITNATELVSLKDQTGTFALGKDIDLSAFDNWTPVDNFNGTLDGANFKITGLKINALNKQHIGLFSKTSGTFRNLTVVADSVTATGDSSYAGILAGEASGTVENVTVEGSVNLPTYDKVGGMVGYLSGKVKDCVNKAEVLGRNYVGGLAGDCAALASSDYSGSENYGKIIGTEFVGGLAGRLTATNGDYVVELFKNRAEINGTASVGGIVGRVEGNVKFSICENYGKILATGDDVGGILGVSTGSHEISVCKNFADITGQFWVGGILGYAQNVDILATDTENNNKITGVAGVGGIAGRARVVTGATNSGEIVATGYMLEGSVKKAYVGGIAGYLRGAVNCTNNSDITVKTGGIEVGGIAGILSLGASYWHQASGNVNNGKITGEDTVGGIFGSTVTYEGNEGHYYVEHNVNNAVITGENNVGGIVGVAVGGSYSFGMSYKYRYIRFEYNENKVAIVATGKVAGIAASCINVVTDEAIVNTNKTTYGNIFGQN